MTTQNILSHQGLVLAWLRRSYVEVPPYKLLSIFAARADGVFLTGPPQHLVLRDRVSKVPMITGNCDDEGTLFSLIPSLDVTNSSQLHAYIKTFMLPNATDRDIEETLVQYPDDPRAGSPFDTGMCNAITPQVSCKCGVWFVQRLAAAKCV